mmetsp:Transcript_113331/g.366574  ORF Transcript_113331/g.366574 Transcript_113331/m.366574 type:complete len:460 (-) Transcript_113331:44-1423(-)
MAHLVPSGDVNGLPTVLRGMSSGSRAFLMPSAATPSASSRLATLRVPTGDLLVRSEWRSSGGALRNRPALSWGRHAPPPPPPAIWQQPVFWASAAAVLAATLFLSVVVRRLRRGGSLRFGRARERSRADMYFQLEQSMLKSSDRRSFPQVVAEAKASPAVQAPARLPPVAASMTPPAPSVAPLPAADPVPSAEAVKEPEAAPATAVAQKKEERQGFGWLKRGSQQSQAPPLSELFAESDAEDLAFSRAVASELAVEAPDGCFDDITGLKSIPRSVPKPTQLMLLHAAVKAEAEKLKPVRRANAVMRVAETMITDLVDRAANLGERNERVEALNNLVAIARETSALSSELAPDVESNKPQYAGQLRSDKLEKLYTDYVDSSVEQVQAQTTAMLSSLMGGAMGSSMEQMQAQAEQSEVLRIELAAVLKIPEGKAEKLMEKRAKAMSQDLMKGLSGLGDLSA